jgi:hypothetical protein
VTQITPPAALAVPVWTVKHAIPFKWANDSETEAEFQKTVNKSKAMLKAVALAETFARTT